MITLLPPIPDAPATLATLSNLVALLADPAASKLRVAELQTASAALQQAVVDHKASIAALGIAEQDHRAAVSQQSADAAEKLAADRSAFNTECLQRKQLLDDREARLTELQSEAAADAKAAKTARTDYERRLAIIRSATG
jgi:hypothetical protein